MIAFVDSNANKRLNGVPFFSYGGDVATIIYRYSRANTLMLCDPRSKALSISPLTIFANLSSMEDVDGGSGVEQ